MCDLLAAGTMVASAPMAYTVPKASLVTYAPEAMAGFYVYCVEWIDNLHFLLPPFKIIPDAENHIAAARAAFLAAGWEGDGDIDLLWIPPFVLPAEQQQPPWLGIIVWH